MATQILSFTPRGGHGTAIGVTSAWEATPLENSAL